MKRGSLLIVLPILFSCTTQKGIIKTPSGLQYEILKKGSGAPAKAGQEVLIYETTTYLSGKILYSNENTKQPVKVLIGGNQATQAVDEGLRGIRVGEVRRLTAPPYLVKRTEYPDHLSPASTLVIKIILDKILADKT